MRHTQLQKSSVSPVVGNGMKDTHGAAGVSDSLGVKDNVVTDGLTLFVDPLSLLLAELLVLWRAREQEDHGMHWLRNKRQQFFIETYA